MGRSTTHSNAGFPGRSLAVAAAVLVFALGFAVAAVVAPDPVTAGETPAGATTPTGETRTQPAAPIGATGTTTAAATTTGPTAGAAGRHSARWIVALVVLLGALVVTPFLADFFIAHRWRRRLLDVLASRDLRPAELEILSQQPRGTHGLTRALLAFSVVTMFSLTLLYVLVERPSDQNQLVSNLVSILGTLAAAVIAFYFGTRAAEGAGETRRSDGGENGDRRRDDRGGRGASTNTVAPSVSGTARVGASLSASPGTWTGSPTLTYGWERCDEQGVCEPISGATGDSYTPVDGDVGKTIRVIVTAGTRSAASAPIGPVAAS